MRVEISNKQKVYDLTTEQIKVLKEKLSFNNPSYENAVKYGRSRYISIPRYLEYFEESSVRREDGTRSKCISVPIGVNLKDIFPNEHIIYSDLRVNKKSSINYPNFNLELRKDQAAAEKSYLSSYNTNSICPSSIIQLPTAKGKSILALHIASVLKAKTLILVHKDDLVVGWTNDAKKCFGNDYKVGLIKAKKREVRDITIATVQTLNKLTMEELSQYINEFDLVIQDEVHHIGLNIFNVINKFNAKYKLGLSATPTRSDDLNFVFDLFLGGLCYRYEYDEKDTDIFNVDVTIKSSNFQYRPILHKGLILNYYDYLPKDLPDTISFIEDMDYSQRPNIPYLKIDDAIVKSRKHMIQVCKDIINEYKQGHSCLVLFTQKEHIRQYRNYLKMFIPKEQILLYYGDSNEKSEVLMQKAEDKECLVTLATYAKATEGTNVKSWEVAFLVSSLNNEKNVEQAVGRIRRSKEDKLNPVRLYDYSAPNCYSVRRHIHTRIKVYERLHFNIKGNIPISKSKMFSRGYN